MKESQSLWDKWAKERVFEFLELLFEYTYLIDFNIYRCVYFYIKKLKKYLKTIEESYTKLFNDGAEITEKERDNLQFTIEINLERAETLTREIFM